MTVPKLYRRHNARNKLFTYSHTHRHTEPLYGSMDPVQDNPGEPIPEESFTLSHLSWSSIVPYTHTHTQHTTVLLLFWNMSGTTRVSRYQKGKTRKVKKH